jgi:hypothetical protein
MASRLQRPPCLLEILGEATSNSRNLAQQNFTEFNLRGEHGWRYTRARQVAKLNLGVPDSAK